ncbi:amine oxidase [Neoconidiobolus thromboides FSU 785]|nr:amine oxidase [Neoconidiobolus thromboides FSU 785]
MKIAVIGSGISGLSSAYFIQEYSEHKVTLYEKGDYFGGHTNTAEHITEDGDKVSIDTGFIVFNELNYPNFLKFLSLLKVDYIPSVMSFAVSKQHGNLEWSGTNLLTLFCQPKNLLNLRFYRMIYDIMRFNYLAPRYLTTNFEWTINQYLTKNQYGPGFIQDYLIPMSAAIWSTSPDKCFMEFPARTLIQFMLNHCLLQVEGRPEWKTIKNGSQSYVSKVLEKLDDKRLNCAIEEVKPVINEGRNQVLVKAKDGSEEYFDHVIMATHGDQSLELLGANASVNERYILSKVKYSENIAFLHKDETLMPINKLAWSSWNYICNEKYEGSNICLTYWMNILQSIDVSKYSNFFVTLNPTIPPRKDSIIKQVVYHHPIYSMELIEAQQQLNLIQNQPDRQLSFVGAWTGYGFHEDGLLSSLKVLKNLNIELPFQVDEEPAKVVPSSSLSIIHLIFTSFFMTIDFFIIYLLLPLLAIFNVKNV